MLPHERLKQGASKGGTLQLVFNLTIEGLRKGSVGIKTGKKLEVIKSITGVKEVIDVKPFVEGIEREIENLHYDFTRTLEEYLTVEKELPKKLVKEDFVIKFLQHQATGKKQFNEVNLIVYLLLHTLISKILLYRLMREPENINGYFIMYYKHLTDVLYNITYNISSRYKGSLECADLNLVSTAENLKLILDNIHDYLGLITTASRYVCPLLTTLVGNVREEERLFSVEVTKKSERDSVNVMVFGNKGKIIFTLCRKPTELILLVLELKLKEGSARRGLAVTSGIKDKEGIKSEVRSNLKTFSLISNINVMPVEEEFWAIYL